MRLFIAIKLPERIIDEILLIQESLAKSDLFFGKMTERENLHLTLKFLGEVNLAEVEEIRKRLRNVSWYNFESSIDYMGVFDEKFLRIIWLHLTNTEKLQKAIDLELVDLFKMEKRFMSHLTISRIKKIKEKEKLLQTIKGFKLNKLDFKINSFCLMESKLSAKGPEYRLIEEYKNG